MTIDLKAPEVQEAIRAAVDEATVGLKTKNEELVGEVRKLRKGKEIDPAELERRDETIAELQGKLDEANKLAKTAKADAEKATKALATEQGFTQRLLVDNGLTAELVKAGVKEAVHIKAAKAMLAAQVQIVADGENRVAKVGDKTLEAFVGEWAKGDEGKHFVAAPANNGGGANGGNKGGEGKSDKLPDIKPGATISAADKAARTAAIQARLDKLGAEATT